MTAGEVYFGEQMASFGLAVLLGGLLASVYAVLLGWRRAAHSSRTSVNVQDALLMPAYAIVCYCFMLVRCDGRLRLFVPIAMLLGAGVAALIACEFITAWSEHLFCAVLGVRRWIFVHIFVPIWRAVSGVSKKAAHFGLNIAKKLKNILAKRPATDV